MAALTAVVRSLAGNILCEVDAQASARVADVRTAAADRLGLRREGFQLLHGARRLYDHEVFCVAVGEVAAAPGLAAEPPSHVVELLLLNCTGWQDRVDSLLQGRATLEVRADRFAVLAAVERDPEVLPYADPGLLKDREFMLSAVKLDSRALSYANAELRSDVDIVLAAAESGGVEALHCADMGCRALVLAVVARHGGALRFASKRLRADAEVVRVAVSQDAAALQYAAPARRVDKEVVLAAVAKDGRALQVAGAPLRADREVVLRAVAQNPRALAFASPELQQDQDVLAAARVAGGGRLRRQRRPRMVTRAAVAVA